MSELPAPLANGPAPLALDVDAGLDRLMGDRAMYLRVLARFRSDYTGIVTRLRAAIAAGDGTLAHRIAHTLKGAAAMIEARALRMLAVDAEQQLRAGAPLEAALLDCLEVELGRVIACVESLSAAPAAHGADAGEAALADGELAQLCALLDLGDSGAQDFMAEKRGGLRARLGAARMTELESAVAAFDYERALHLVGAAQAHQLSG